MDLLHFVSIDVRSCLFTSLSKWENDELNLLLIMTNKILYDLSSRFHVAVHLFSNRELKHATFLSHGRQPEVNILQARTNVSPRFSK